ncbi:unnamed protein product [Vitrella brassicaformis CCMP3155]|uniref:Nucleotide-diphospho-sugar transferase domain-containing protein n=1 Tax=Vitrella brassicaformis (strain CCMP3155) TaxID=1169540 RepID=A0A0G4EHJ9_VITBC|nr:unnamed protein product [Vitrella brassicaformis CCMP3155]|eukprot:CEL95495.1 unnamed protein product [Vitrella brassicaformis CCMP3155]
MDASCHQNEHCRASHMPSFPRLGCHRCSVIALITVTAFFNFCYFPQLDTLVARRASQHRTHHIPRLRGRGRRLLRAASSSSSSSKETIRAKKAEDQYAMMQREKKRYRTLSALTTLYDDFVRKNRTMLDWVDAVARAPKYPEGAYEGRGIVYTTALDDRYLVGMLLSVWMVRQSGCHLPVQVMFVDSKAKRESHLLPQWLREEMRALNIEAVSLPFPNTYDPYRDKFSRFVVKPLTILLSRFEETLFIDSDNFPIRNVCRLFDLNLTDLAIKQEATKRPVLAVHPGPLHAHPSLIGRNLLDANESSQGWARRQTKLPLARDNPEQPWLTEPSAIFWPDYWWFPLDANLTIWEVFGLEKPRNESGMVSQESGQLLVRKRGCWKPLVLTGLLNWASETFYDSIYGYAPLGAGDNDTFMIAWLAYGWPSVSYYFVPWPAGVIGPKDHKPKNAGRVAGKVIAQHEPDTGEILFLHAVSHKLIDVRTQLRLKPEDRRDLWPLYCRFLRADMAGGRGERAVSVEDFSVGFPHFARGSVCMHLSDVVGGRDLQREVGAHIEEIVGKVPEKEKHIVDLGRVRVRKERGPHDPPDLAHVG